MRWLRGNSANFNQIEVASQKKDKYAVRLTPRPHIPANSGDGEDGEDNSDIEYIEVISTGIQSVDRVKQHLLDILSEYDSSDEVNVFYFNGKKHWIDVNKRNAIYHSCELFEKKGNTTYDLWVEDVPITLPISVIKVFLTDLEEYAKACYDVTALHTAEIRKLTKIEDILKYNITVGYPKAIEFDNYLN